LRDNYNTGKGMFLYFYYVEVFLTFITGVIFKNLDFVFRVSIVIYLLASLIFLGVISKPNVVSEKTYKYISGFLFSVMAVLMGLQMDNTQIFVYAVYVHSVVLISYIDAKAYLFHSVCCAIDIVCILISMYVMGIDTFNVQDYTMGIFGVCGVQWMSANLIKHISFQQRKSMEQERSLDDLLKVVEAKCEEARHATRSKSDFLSSMSHEIRTPINAVLGMNEMILRESKDANVVEYATNISSSGKMLLSLVNDILDFSKIESGRMEIIPVEYQLSSVLNDLVNMIMPKAKEKELKLILDINKDIPNILYGDEVRIRQVVTNLLTNAVKYTDYGSVLLSTTFEKKGYKEIELKFSVKDTGRGIKGSDIESLFDEFQRIEEKKNRNIEGTGLGLTITKRFVDMMQGTLDVDSVYGGGSTFTVSIPQKVVKDVPMGDFNKQYVSGERAASHYHESFIAPDANILVVDDNVMNLKVAVGLLKQTQIRIDTATSGKECLEMLRKGNYNLLLLDHMMADMDGLATIRRIRAEGLDKNVPIIALTANAVSGAREMYIDYGFADYLSKPIASRELEKILYTLLPKDLVINTKSQVSETWYEQEYNSNIIDVRYGIKLCGEDLYEDILSTYYGQGRDNIERLEELFADGRWAEYGILVHAIKSTSLNVGAKTFSEIAKEQEQRINNGDLGYVLSSFQEFIREYKKVLAEAKQILDKSL